GVGSRLTITKLAPFCSASIGNMFAGVTEREEPSTMNRSASTVSCSAFKNVSWGSISPNNTIPGLIGPPHEQCTLPSRYSPWSYFFPQSWQYKELKVP